jgi:hypothetical protein
MKRNCSALTLAVFSLFLIAGCGDKSTGPAGSGLNENAGALDSHAGNNTPVKDSITAATVGQMVQTQATEAANKVFMMQGMSKRTSSTQSGTIDGTINGTKSGTATVKGSYTSNQSNASVEALCTFSNYSDSGDIYLGGQMNFVIKMTANQTGDDVTMICTSTGKIKFNGSYIGANTFSLETNLSEGCGTYTSTIVSDGVTTAINVKFP